jgi:hypothetical protein
MIGAPAVAAQRENFQKNLDEQMDKTLNECRKLRLDRGAFHIALARIREMASTLGLSPDDIEHALRDWLFTNKLSDTPTISDLHWGEVHSITQSGRAGQGIARIGFRDASLGTSDADVELLLGEREDVQGMHGVNFGTQTLDARLFLRYDGRESFQTVVFLSGHFASGVLGGKSDFVLVWTVPSRQSSNISCRPRDVEVPQTVAHSATV